jgi:hypothetical protein
VQKAGGDWNSNPAEFTNFVAAPDGSYRLYIIEPGSVSAAIKQDLCYPWNDIVDLSAEKWNKEDLDFTTKQGKTYGVYAGKTEPRQCLFFNKKLLEDAGIDWNTIYDMQADGTWTWDAFVALLQQLTKDTDNDGVYDVYGILGNSTDFYIMSVFSNNGAFFAYDEQGDLQPAMTSDNAMEGMNWGKETWAAYAAPQPADTQWNWFVDAWLQGYCGFYMYQTYGGFNDNSEMASADFDWGCVAFPKGPRSDTYVTVSSDNITLMPNVYTDKEAADLGFIYDMWTNPTPGFEEDDNWIGNKLNYTDSRAVLETYAMLREPEHVAADLTLNLGKINDVTGNGLLWNLGWDTPGSQIEQTMPRWISLCEEFNAEIK